jgi:hypothetical protein
MFSTNRAPILHQHQHYLHMDQNEIRHDPRHLGVSSGASKTFFDVVVHLAQTVHLSCVKISTIFERTESSFHLRLVTRSNIGCVQNDFWAYGTFGANRAPILRQDYHYHQTNSIKHPLELRHLRVPLGAAKMISEHLVHSAQTMHLSCVKISTISNELGQASTWASSPRSTIGCVQNDFWPYGMFSTNHAPILNRHQHYLQMDQNKIPHDPHLLGVPSGASKLIYEVGVRSAQTMHLLASRLALSSNRLNRASTWASSPNSTTRCVQNYFWAYSMFGPSYAPILH